MRFNKETFAKFASEIEEMGYRKYAQNYKTEDFTYWKSFEISKDEHGDRIIGYQIGFLVYDFSQMPSYTHEYPIQVQCDFLIGSNEHVSRIDFVISDDNITVKQFETYCKKFYEDFCIGFIFKDIDSNKQSAQHA